MSDGQTSEGVQPSTPVSDLGSSSLPSTPHEASLKDKQDFLKRRVLDKGLDGSAFIKQLEQEKKDGAKLENWTLEELTKKVDEYEKKNAKVTAPDLSPIPIATPVSHSAGASKGPVTPSNPKLFAEDDDMEELTDKKRVSKLDEYMKDKKQTQPESSDEERDKGELPLDMKMASGRDKRAESSMTTNLMSDVDMQLAENAIHKVIKCKKIEGNELTAKKGQVKIMVTNPKYHNNGVFRFGYTTFEVFTQPFNWRVTRRFKDFQWLRESLVNRFSASSVAID